MQRFLQKISPCRFHNVFLVFFRCFGLYYDRIVWSSQDVKWKREREGGGAGLGKVLEPGTPVAQQLCTLVCFPDVLLSAPTFTMGLSPSHKLATFSKSTYIFHLGTNMYTSVIICTFRSKYKDVPLKKVLPQWQLLYLFFLWVNQQKAAWFESDFCLSCVL